MDLDEIYDAMTERDVVTAVVHYSGSGDEGYIEEIDFNPPFVNRAGETDAERDARQGALFDLLRDEAYDIVNRYYSGWEINEGSEGEVTFDAEARTTRIHHGEHTVQTQWSDMEV